MILVWLAHYIKDQMKYFLSFIFQVSNHRNMHCYLIIQETAFDYSKIYKTCFML